MIKDKKETVSRRNHSRRPSKELVSIYGGICSLINSRLRTKSLTCCSSDGKSVFLL